MTVTAPKLFNTRVFALTPHLLCCRLHSAGHLLDICMHNLGLSHLEPGKGHHFPDGYDVGAVLYPIYHIFLSLISF